MNAPEIIVVCTMLMCPPDFAAVAVPLGAGQQFDSSAIGGSWLRPFCFINPSRFRGGRGQSGYIRVIEWTDRVIRVEATPQVRVCRGRSS